MFNLKVKEKSKLCSIAMDLAKHVTKLSGATDWPIWKRKIRDLIDYHDGALDALDGKIAKPEPLQAGAKAEEEKKHKEQSDFFRKANSYAKSMITTAVTDSVYQKIMDKETAHDTWEALKNQFEATAKDQVFRICNEFFAFSWNPGNDVSTHIAKLRSLWNDLNQALKAKNENELPDLILVCKTLHILPKTFETFRHSWMLLTKEEEKTFDELTNQIVMFERNFRPKENDEKESQEALATTAQKEHRQDSGASGRRYDTCNYCKKRGHWVRNCIKWKKDGRPKPKKQDAEQGNCAEPTLTLFSVHNGVFAAEANSEVDWWIDNGATKHVVKSAKYFEHFEKFENPSWIRAAGNETLSALGQGTIRVKTIVDGKTLFLSLKNVWFVPKITKNLFSVLAAQDNNPSSRFESSATKCTLKINDKIVLVGAREVGGTLYRAAIEPILPERNVDVNLATSGTSILQLYHERWGHQDKKHIKEMLKREMGIEVKLESSFCEPCIFGKAHRLPFGTRKTALKPGELMSGDVCGPFEDSFQKKRYLVVFKDHFTRFRYGYIVKQKSEVKDVLRHMVSHAKQQGHTIREFLSDNGGEFDCSGVREILQEAGITFRLTAPYTPEQNGGVERENRTIVEMARTFKYSNPEIKFPQAIWAELVSTAVYILNRTGKSSLKGLSPYQLWLGKKPRIKHLRIVGSTCYVHIPSQKRRKMDEKAEKGYLVGYDGDERYRIYLPKKHKVVVSRDVKFQEKFSNCESSVNLPFQDSESKDVVEDKEEEDVSSHRSEDEDTLQEQDLKEDTTETESEDNYETGGETSFDEGHDKRRTQSMRLRDRSKLKRSQHLDDYIAAAENFVLESPDSFHEAINSNIEWKKAMDREIDSLHQNETWNLTRLPKGLKALPCKWVFRVKTNPDGSIDKYKARLVVKGFAQRQGIDYDQTFSSVARMETIRSVLSVAAKNDMFLVQFDVSTAFLYGELDDKEIYMQQPEGYEQGQELVCRLKKSLYGLKQGPRCWQERFGGFLQKHNFQVSEADPCLYIRERNGKKILLVVYVDDGLAAATDTQDLEEFLDELKSEFKIVSSKAECFLGLEIKKQENGLKISQQGYATRILERFRFLDCKAVSTPLLKNSEISTAGKESETTSFPYRQAIGALMYLMLGTRPDLAFSIGFLSRTLENPTNENIAQVKRVFRYISGTINLGIVYRKQKKGILECYSDADFGGCTKTGRSTSGIIIMFASGTISWKSQRQAMVAISTTEAEIVAANEAAKEIIWLKSLFQEIDRLDRAPILQVDNAAAMKLAQNPEFHRRTKHIANKHFFIREKIAEREFGIEQISTEEQLADMMTKPILSTRLRILCNKIGLF